MAEIVSVDLFDRLYHEALDLAERSAAYFAGPSAGAERDALTPEASPCYAIETLRMTTQQMQCIAWLLLRRAVRQGEVSAEAAAAPANRLGGHRVCDRPWSEGAEALPDRLKVLMAQSRALFDRIDRLDRFMHDHAVMAAVTRPAGRSLTAPGASVVAFGLETLDALRAERARRRRAASGLI